LAEQHVAESQAEAANAGERAYADGNGQHHEQEAAAGGAELGQSDAEGG
jgi:hypothetical protein